MRVRVEPGHQGAGVKNFRPRGEGVNHCRARARPGDAAHARPRASARQAKHRRRCSASKRLRFAPILRHLKRGLAVVVVLAQGLQVALVGEQRPVAAMRLDVVNDRRPRPDPLAAALAAEGLTQQLRRAQAIRPDRQIVPGVVRSGHAPLVLRPVLIAPALAGQHRASRMPARFEWQRGHGVTSGEKKKPEPAACGKSHDSLALAL